MKTHFFLRNRSGWFGMVVNAIFFGVLAVSVRATVAEVELVTSFSLEPVKPGLHNDLVQHPTDGHFYGTTASGGAHSFGSIFRMTTSGEIEPLVHFTGNGVVNRGANPHGRLTLGPDGRFYGATQQGGAHGWGTVFAVTTSGLLTTLVDFQAGGAAPGYWPFGHLALGADGRLYGMTNRGGGNDYGTVFAVTTEGVVTTLVHLDWSSSGGQPYGGLIAAADGLLYGMTSVGGNSFSGNVFRMTTAGVLTPLVVFNGSSGVLGENPYGHLLQAADGHFYGMTSEGGPLNFGTLFKLDSGTSAVTTLVQFSGNGALNKGALPYGDLVQGAGGALYGMTSKGGALDLGTVFKVTTAGVLTTLAEFTGTGGALPGQTPQGSFTVGADGRLYGMTNRGGSDDEGTVVVVNADDTVESLRAFRWQGHSEAGVHPRGGLVVGPDGALYGVTGEGGSHNKGTIFKLNENGQRSSVLSFTGTSGSNKGAGPSGLVVGADGHFYGTTRVGGESNRGTLFRMTAAGTLTTLVELTGGSGPLRGENPSGGMILANDGHFYGTTATGGNQDYGTVFRLTQAGVMTVLADFTSSGAVPGANPAGPLLELADGYLYGTTYSGGLHASGTLFRISKAGVLETLVSFTGMTGDFPGAYPTTSLIQGRDGKLYGTTGSGGVHNQGLVYRFAVGGSYEVLFEFDTYSPAPRLELGANPGTGLIQGSDGFFYGMTAWGMDGNKGALYRMSEAGEMTSLVEFAGGGVGPESASDANGTFFVTGPDGHLYGLTERGGPGGGGAILRVLMPPPPSVRARVGESLVVDLSFIPLASGQTLRVTGLPTGVVLVLGPPPQLVGTVYGPAAESGVRVDVMAGRKVVRSLWLDLEIAPFAHLGSFEALLEEASGEVSGRLRVTVTNPTAKRPAPAYTATLEHLGQPRRVSKGELPSASDAVQNVELTFPAIPNQPALLFSVTMDAGSDLISGMKVSDPSTVLRGFRLAQPQRIPGGNPRLTMSFDPDTPASSRVEGAAGVGHAVGSIDAKARVRLAGRLGDNQLFTTTVALSQTQQAVLWITPYRNKESSVGGIFDFVDLDLPGRGAPTESAGVGLHWRKAADSREKAYPAGFLETLALTGRISRWYPTSSAEALAQSLGLVFRQIQVSYFAAPSDPLPRLVSLRDRFSLLRLLPNNAVSWSGKVNPRTGAFTGLLGLPPPASRSRVSGVLLQSDAFGQRVGAGLIQIPFAGAVRGFFETAGIELEQAE